MKITRGRLKDSFSDWNEIKVDGATVVREVTNCRLFTRRIRGAACGADIYFTEADVRFRAESSNPDENQARAEVDEILARIHVLPEGQTTIPPRESVVLDKQATSGDAYVRLLKQMGLKPRVEYVQNKKIPDGFAVGVDPAVGTPVKVGDEVTVRVTGDPAKNTSAPNTEESVDTSKDGSDEADPLDVPDGMRLVGLKNVAALVPETWATNKIACGTPMANTVVIDPGAIPLCLIARPIGVQSMTIQTGRFNKRGSTWTDVERDGATAERMRTSCSTGSEGTFCTAELWFPEEHVGFRAESFQSDATLARSQVENMLGQVRVLPEGYAVVPGFRHLVETPGGAAKYRALLVEQGFVVREQVTPADAHPAPGGFTGVDPGPGTPLRTGEVVTMLVSAS